MNSAPMVKREHTADYVNVVLSDPTVRKGARIKEKTDLSGIVADDRNILLTYDGGCFLLVWRNHYTFEVHTLALPEGRGQKLREAIHEAMEYVFFKTPCTRLLTIAYKDNPAAVALSDNYFIPRGENDEYIYYELCYHEWVQFNVKALEVGQMFHEGLETNHAEDHDELHDFFVGGAILMVQAGLSGKAAFQYNRWAEMSGYERIEIVNECPLIMKIGEMKLKFDDGIVQVISHASSSSDWSFGGGGSIRREQVGESH